MEATEPDCIEVLGACEGAGENADVPFVSPRLEEVGGGETVDVLPPFSDTNGSVVASGKDVDALLLVGTALVWLGETAAAAAAAYRIGGKLEGAGAFEGGTACPVLDGD